MSRPIVPLSMPLSNHLLGAAWVELEAGGLPTMFTAYHVHGAETAQQESEEAVPKSP